LPLTSRIEPFPAQSLSPYAAPGDAQSKAAVNSATDAAPDLKRRESCLIMGLLLGWIRAPPSPEAADQAL
jgi:hypothetical protein